MNEGNVRKRLFEIENRAIQLIAPHIGTDDFETQVALLQTRFDLGGGDAESPAEASHRRGAARRNDPSRRDDATQRDDPFSESVFAAPGSEAALQRGSTEAGPADHAVPDDPVARQRRLDEIAAQIRECTRCPLHIGRTNAVPGEGVLDPLVMVVGEGPGAQEDAQGKPFVGNAGQYLDKWLAAIGLSRETNVFIANIVKCRPPGNRDPQPEESDACLPYLREQIELVRPRLILTLGRISMRILTGTTHGITRVHGTFYHFQGIPLVPTFHPSGVLRNPAWRRPVWEDLKSVRNWLIDNAGHSAPPAE